MKNLQLNDSMTSLTSNEISVQKRTEVKDLNERYFSKLKHCSKHNFCKEWESVEFHWLRKNEVTEERKNRKMNSSFFATFHYHIKNNNSFVHHIALCRPIKFIAMYRKMPLLAIIKGNNNFTFLKLLHLIIVCAFSSSINWY